jgi:hypothetical protein
MAFENKSTENENLLAEHQKNIDDTGYKKYVVQIHNSYIDLLDNLTQDERNDVINDILATYSDDMQEKQFWKNTLNISLKVLLVLFILIVVVPFFFTIFVKSLELTSSTNKQMQHNFEVLYQKSGK